MNPLRKSAPYAVAFICLALSGLGVLETSKEASTLKDTVGPWDEHMKMVRSALPENVLSIGYLEAADIPDSGARIELSEFHLTQYGIAPVVLVPGSGEEWILGNFGNTIESDVITNFLDDELGAYSIDRLGFGLYMIHDLED